MPDSEAVIWADRFLAGEQMKFADVNAKWQQLRDEDQLSLARRVLERLREEPDCLLDGPVPNVTETRDMLCQQEALLTSKDAELNAASRHNEALALLADRFTFIDNKTQNGDTETLGIAGGIAKRRWNDLGQLKDLLAAADFYGRGASNDLGDDAYPHINAAFVEDLLAAAGDRPDERRQRAAALRENILAHIKLSDTWFNAATRAEALFGLRRYAEATAVLQGVRPEAKRALWKLRTGTEQLAQLAHLQEQRPLMVPEIRAFFDTLLPGAGDAISSVIIGKVGLAFSGGGFRASYYHLGVLACLAERDVLRHVEVLSCVSGGSIVGAFYWLKLRQRMLKPEPLTRDDYITLVQEMIGRFQEAVGTNLRGQVQPYVAKIAWRLLTGAGGVLDPEKTAAALEQYFYRPLWPDDGPIQMDQLAFQPADHNPALAGPGEFNPGKHNWLRAHKVPALILNATTVNTGHAWHFTPTWMGESPWAVYEAADSIPRLQWSTYDQGSGWQINLGRAVAASACVPMVFAPLRLGPFYGDSIQVSLVDGGVHDNQGTVALLASNCNLVLVSDACGQLLMESAPPPGLKGLIKSTMRSSDTLMERVRLASFGDLDSRRRSGLLRGLMFLHMKAGLDADTIRLPFSQETYRLRRAPLTPSGVRKEFQQALAELRTDLDIFGPDESCGLMACGYQMASKAIEQQLPRLRDVWAQPPNTEWPFKDMLAEITSTAMSTPRRDERLRALRQGQGVDFLGSSPSRILKDWRWLRSRLMG